jgi:serine/threonine protein kinase
LERIEARKEAKVQMTSFEVPTAEEEYMQEIEIAKRFQGHGIIEIHRVIELDTGEKVMVLKAAGYQFEFNGEKKTVIELSDLIELIRKFRMSDSQREQLMTILDDVFQGMERLHARGYIHRDLKPENILITKEGRGALTDFGTVCRVKDDPAKSRYFGTPRYSAPESCAYADQDTWKNIDEKSDVWSAGMVLMQSCFDGKSTSDHRAIDGMDNGEAIKGLLRDKIIKPRVREAYLKLYVEPKDKTSLEHLVWWATRLDPEERPTMTEFRARFNQCRKQGMSV